MMSLAPPPRLQINAGTRIVQLCGAESFPLLLRSPPDMESGVLFPRRVQIFRQAAEDRGSTRPGSFSICPLGSSTHFSPTFSLFKVVSLHLASNFVVQRIYRATPAFED